jgi:hypothetical protein
MTVRGRRPALCLLALVVGGGVAAAAAVKTEVSEARMRKDVTYLASPECEGRGPFTAGINKAADYVAAAFKEAGLKGAMPDGSYFQPFTMKGPARLGKDNAVTLQGPSGNPVALSRGDEFQPVSASGSGTANAPIVFAGYGITTSDPNYDDYAGLDAAGKVVLIIRRSPRYDQEGKEFSKKLEAYAPFMEKVENAAKHKAVGVLMVNDHSEEGDRIPAFRDGEAGTLPFAHVKRAQADAMLKSALGKSLQDIEDAIDADLKPINGPITGWTAKLAVTVNREQYPVKNVVGVLEGAGPLANQTVVIGAHYDHLGFGDRGSLGRGSKEMHPGADDNGSGTTAVIELARRFGAIPNRQGRRMVFMTFSGEEQGLLGSIHYCKNPIFPLADTTAMINLDMVGRLAEDKDTHKDKLIVYGTGSAKTFDALIENLNKKPEYDFKLKKTPTGVGPSDQQSFYVKGVPVLFFFTDTHKDYHKPSDTADKINLPGMRRVVDMTEEVALALTTEPARPEYVKVAGGMPTMSRGRSGPLLGIMPDYDDEKEGLLITSVSPGGAAEKAGLKDGDRIVELAGKPVKNVTGYMAIMAGAKKGEPIDVVIERGGQRQTVKAMPQ